MQVRRVNELGFSSTEEGNELKIDDQRARLDLIVRWPRRSGGSSNCCAASETRSPIGHGRLCQHL
jgi:hypothetical protein